ncbi:MAG: GNAT family N-acetyltransferase [Nanoarchaeota archaeon]|nr:GNAT family N-acetyltransferase [Nanoarchaeota archaeon]MBU1028487.1 GNAT family N-acetyltransferase [Nanoarchaeota archaeon]
MVTGFWGDSLRFTERLPNRFNLKELKQIRFISEHKRYPLIKEKTKLVKGETEKVISRNNDFDILFYPRNINSGTEFEHIIIFINGFDEKSLELFYYYNKSKSLSKLLEDGYNQNYSDLNATYPKLACVLMPIPFHHWRRPIKFPYNNLNSSQMIFDNAIRLYLGFEQMLCDIQSLCKIIKAGTKRYLPYANPDAKIHLLGYSLGGLATLSSYLLDKITKNNHIETCTLLASGVDLSHIDLSHVKLELGDDDDENDISELFKQFWEIHKWIDPLLEPAKKLNHLKSAKKSIKEKKKNRFFIVAEIDGKVVGYKEFFIKEQDKFFKIKKYGYLDSTVVHKNYRKKGIAKKLTQEALKILKKNGIKYFKSNVYLKNKTALKTWKKIGFKKLSVNLFKELR